jgi:hypothetical protein
MRKWFRLSFLALVSVFLISCGSSGGGSSGSSGDKAGDISGLGNNTGELSGEEFVLPDGVEIDSGGIQGHKIMGKQVVDIDDSLTEFSSKFDNELYTPNYNIVSGTYDAAVGSGYSFVDVLIPLRNHNNVTTKVIFPARLIARSSTGEYQNGVLIKETSITLPANSLYKVMLTMYCGNLHRHVSYGEIYDRLIVSDSAILKDLTDRVVNKKINVEEYADSEESEYWETAIMLQSAVWSLTEHSTGLTKDMKDWIAALPNSL